MTPEQAALLGKAYRSAEAAKLLSERGHYDFAASRAYYAMLYVAEALLLGKGLAFSSHSAVNAAFGEHFARTGAIDRKFHRYLIDGQKTRTKSDYDMDVDVSESEASEQIAHAEEFLEAAEQFLASPR